MKDELLHLAKIVEPHRLLKYLKSTGWKEEKHNTPLASLLRRGNGSKAKLVVIPSDRNIDDYEIVVLRAIDTISNIEKCSTLSLALKLSMPDSDLFQLRCIGNATKSGTITLDEGLRVLNSTKRALEESAASTSKKRAETKEFCGKIQLGQTALGSYVFTVACPLSVNYSLPGMEASEERIATKHFGLSIQAIIRHDPEALSSPILSSPNRMGITNSVTLSWRCNRRAVFTQSRYVPITRRRSRILIST
jgi:hypothetical protein